MLLLFEFEYYMCYSVYNGAQNLNALMLSSVVAISFTTLKQTVSDLSAA